MPPVDCARWTTILTASYLALTAALITILGQSRPRPRQPGRAAPDALRVAADPEPREAVGGNPSRDSRLASVAAVSLPLQGSGAAGGGHRRLAVDRGDSGLGVGAVRWTAEPVPERAAGVRAAVRVPALLLPVLRDRRPIGGGVLVRQRTAGGLRRAAAAVVDRDARAATCSSSCCRWTARTTCRSAWARRSPATSSSISFIRCPRAAARAAAHFPAHTCRVRSS